MPPQVCLTPNPAPLIQPHGLCSVLAKPGALEFLPGVWPRGLVTTRTQDPRSVGDVSEQSDQLLEQSDQLLRARTCSKHLTAVIL